MVLPLPFKNNHIQDFMISRGRGRLKWINLVGSFGAAPPTLGWEVEREM